jgi:hypothetical protein
VVGLFEPPLDFQVSPPLQSTTEGISNMRYHILLLLVLRRSYIARSQTPRCNTLTDGCDGGTTHDAVVKAAIARFDPKKVYGGDEESIVFASHTNSGSSVVSVAYRCTDNSIPPAIMGTTV